jgi:glycosyltransferase involved in cell wall biosynthesis
MKKLLHIAKYYDGRFGGIEEITSLINKKFSNNYDIRTLGFGERNYKEDNVLIFKPLITINSQPISIDFVKEIYRSSKKCDFIYLHYPNVLAIFALLFVKNKKIIIHWHSDIIKQKIFYFFIKWMETKVLKKTSLIIVSSKNYLKSSKPLKKFHNKTSIVNYGIKDPFTNKDFSKKKISDINKIKKINILSIGRLVPYKGQKYLIKAMNYLDNKKYNLTIIGNGPLNESLNKLSDNNNLKTNVSILNNIDTIRKNILLENCHVFCLPSISRAEAFGIVLAEALSYGIPIITFKIPTSGTNFINKNNVTGFIVNEINEKELAKKIDEIFSNSNIYKQLCRNSRNHYLSHFKENEFISKINMLFLKYG